MGDRRRHAQKRKKQGFNEIKPADANQMFGFYTWCDFPSRYVRISFAAATSLLASRDNIIGDLCYVGETTTPTGAILKQPYMRCQGVFQLNGM